MQGVVIFTISLMSNAFSATVHVVYLSCLFDTESFEDLKYDIIEIITYTMNGRQ